MELNTISGLAIAGVICSVVLSMGVPIALFIAGKVKLKARIVLYRSRNLSAVCHAVGAVAACSCHSVLRTERTEQAMALLCVRGFGCSGF